MSEFWNSLLTEKSWKILQDLKREQDFILIGGWAVYLLTKQNKSKDIDIVVSIKELESLKERGLGKNDSLKKYEIKNEEIDIDIYVEYYSKLDIPVADIKKYVIMSEGFRVARPEVMLLLKLGAFLDRKDSIKGEKDKIDILSLLFFSEVDLQLFFDIATKYSLGNYAQILKNIVVSFRDFSYLNLKPSELKNMKEEFIKNWKKIR